MNFKIWLENKNSKNTNEIISKIKALKLNGWGGRCGQAAIELNHKIFNGKGKYIVAVNKFLWDFESEFIGHVAIKYNNQLWDADGLTNMEKLESWGMVDEHDPDYTGKFGWTTESAYEVEIMEMTEDQIKHWLGKYEL
jgi:hypothetical protein